MKSLTNVLDALVLKLKKSKGLSGVRFVHGGRGAFAERPVEDFLITCSVAKEEFKREKDKGEEYTGTMEFTLYAPQGEGKRALALLSERLAKEIKALDTKGDFEKITVADSSFDSNMSVWKQVVSVLYAHRAENASEEYYESVYLGTTKLDGVLSFGVVEECSAYELRELLSGGTEEYVDSRIKYTITMSVYGEDMFLKSLANRNVNIYRENTNMTYDDCRLQRIEDKVSGRQILTFICRRAHKGAEVTV